MCSSNESATVGSETTEAQALLPKLSSQLCSECQQTSCIWFLPRHLSLTSKAVGLILAWTLIFSVIYAAMLSIAAALISNSIGSNHFRETNPITSPFCIMYSLLAVISMLYPLSGFVADVWCGRFKTVMIGLSCLLLSTTIAIALLIWYTKGYNLKLTVPLKEAAPTYATGLFVAPFIVTGLAAYQANFIQLGLDQLVEKPSKYLSLFVHWAIWIDVVGTAIVALSFGFMGCTHVQNSTKVTVLVTPCLILFSFPFILVLSCWKHRWFIAVPAQHNPYKTVTKVLNFARKHKWPLQRSAFTYCDDEKPSRIDFAKERYGGPFTTEQVEDVKTFLRILALILTLGPLLIMDIPTSYMGFVIFGQHTGYLADYRHRCSIWAILESGALRYITGTLFLPCYILFHFSVLEQRIKMFTRLWVGLFLYFLGLLSMLTIDLAGHLRSVSDQGTGSHCVFTYVRVNGTSYTLLYPVLEMHWAVLIPPNILLGIGPPIVMTTVLEFISAQSPQSMKGLLIGVFFSIKGIFQLLSTLSLFLFSANGIWAGGHAKEHPPVTNCGFSYFLFVCVAAMIGLILFSVVAKRYKYRQRDDRPYDQSQIEEIFYRRTLMRPASPDYTN